MARQSRCLMGGAAVSVVLDRVAGRGAVVLAEVARSQVWLRIGSPTNPPSRLRPSLAPCSGGQEQALRARLRASLTAPARDASSAAQGRDEETAASRTRKRADPDSRMARALKAGRPRLPSGMKGGPLRGRAFPFPFPRAVERPGTGTGNGAPQGFARR